MIISLSSPDITNKDIASVNKVLRTRHLSLGPKLRVFEEQIAKYTGVKHALAVSNGTAGLHLIIRAMGIKKGDEVITPPFSFISSANCILYENAVPVFVDIRPDTLTIDTEKIEEKITARTKAILAVDVFAHPAEWDKLRRIAGRHKLLLIEDSAEALGSQYKGKKCGSFADAAVFSFYPNKQITTGEGGMIVSNDKNLIHNCCSMSNQGRKFIDGKWFEHAVLGYNYRMSDINAALGLSQLSRIKSIIKKRHSVAMAYHKRLKAVADVEAPFTADNIKINWFVYVVRLAQGYTGSDRAGIISYLASKGIQCGEYFKPIHLQPFYQKKFGYRPGHFPVCEALAQRTIALPFYNNLKPCEVDYVVKNLSQGIKKCR